MRVADDVERRKRNCGKKNPRHDVAGATKRAGGAKALKDVDVYLSRMVRRLFRLDFRGLCPHTYGTMAREKGQLSHLSG